MKMYSMNRICSLLLLLHICYSFEFPRFTFLQKFLSNKNTQKKKNNIPIFLPIEKFNQQPVLKVTDSNTQTEVFLVGVSHGSPASSELVEETIQLTKPDSVVLELCYDRYLSICLDANLNPYGDDDFIMKLNQVREKIKKKDLKQQQNALKSDSPLAKLLASGRFIYSQGLIGGFFILVGLLGTSSQLLTSSARTEDEFTTAIRVATENKIPIRLADAPQNDTLQSIKTVISTQLFNPIEIYYGSRDLIFSLLGLLPQYSSEKNVITSIPTSVMNDSKWINIPQAYTETPKLLKSMLPILITTILLLVFEVSVDTSEATVTITNSLTSISDLTATSNTVDPENNIFSSIFQPFLSSLSLSSVPNSLPLESPSAVSTAADTLTVPNDNISIEETVTNIEQILSTTLHFLEFSFLIRLSKIIGTYRDAILARNIQDFSQEFEGGKIVVVNGMLHSNGVARWLLSGQRPVIIPNKYTATATATASDNEK